MQHTRTHARCLFVSGLSHWKAQHMGGVLCIRINNVFINVTYNMNYRSPHFGARRVRACVCVFV